MTWSLLDENVTFLFTFALFTSVENKEAKL